MGVCILSLLLVGSSLASSHACRTSLDSFLLQPLDITQVLRQRERARARARERERDLGMILAVALDIELKPDFEACIAHDT